MSVFWYVLEVPVAVKRNEESFPYFTTGGSSKQKQNVNKTYLEILHKGIK